MTEANIHLLYDNMSPGTSFPLIAILHVHQSLLIGLCDTPTKIVAHSNDSKYSRVQLPVVASTGKFDCGCSRVQLLYSSVCLRLLESILKFTALKVLTRVWAMHHSCRLVHIRIWHSRVLLQAIRVTCTRVYAENFPWRRGESLRLVGLVETETFHWGLLSVLLLGGGV